MTIVLPKETFRHLRLERDRHVAFAFAAADLLVEVNSEGIIVTASGATHGVVGADTQDLTGRPILEHFHAWWNHRGFRNGADM
jgi:hypothetical protein